MKLRSKLFLTVGILLLLMVITMYIIPLYFIHKDVQSATVHVQKLIEREHQALVKNQKNLLEDILDQIKENLNALLFIVYEENDLKDRLTLTDKSDLKNAWSEITKIAGYDPEIGFIQLHSPQAGKALALLPHGAKFYNVNTQKIDEKRYRVVLQISSKNETEIYLGIPINHPDQADEVTYLALIESKKIQIKELQEELKLSSAYEIESEIAYSSTDFKKAEMQEAFDWAVKMNLIQTLTPLFVEGIALNNGQTQVPEGIAKIEKNGKGSAILSRDFFRTNTVFNDEEYYEKNSSEKSSLPIAQNSAIIIDTKEAHAFLGNTLVINENTYLTLGTPLSPLVKQLALSANKIVVMKVKDNFWIGFNKNGEPLPKNQITDYIDAGLTSKKDGVLKVSESDHLFMDSSSLEDGKINVYTLRSMQGDKSILNTLSQLEKDLSNRISLQLILIALGTMILILIFVGRILLKIIRPITQLAQATSNVAKGRYEDITYPNVGNRKDEVATLTASFKEMVKEIQDREKIHAILDKVVSKEVADEILEKGVQLGGEDRIVTMLFGDIRGFTSLTENLNPQQTIEMLNQCMTKISRVIEGEGGVIDKYVGDEVMAIYGAPNKHPDHALRAISSGVLIIEALKKWNEQRTSEGKPAVEMGIGVHTGLVVAGNMGAADRLNYTVLGSSVNISARLCEIAKANQLIISESTLSEPQIEKSFYIEALEPITLKGFSRPINIYQVTGFKWEEE